MQQTSIGNSASAIPSPENAATSLGRCVELLESIRLRLSEQISHYTRPVAACDADFNSLLVERTEITAALAHLKPLYRGEMHIAHPQEDR